MGFDGVLGQVASREQDEVTRELHVDSNYGLSELSVCERQREYGLNELEGEEEMRAVFHGGV